MTLHELLSTGAIWKYFDMKLIVESVDGIVLYYSGAGIGHAVPPKLLGYEVCTFGAIDSKKCLITINVNSANLMYNGDYLTMEEVMAAYCKKSLACEFGNNDPGFKSYLLKRVADNTLWWTKANPRIGVSTYSMRTGNITTTFAVPTVWAERWYKDHGLEFGNKEHDVISEMENYADVEGEILSRHYHLHNEKKDTSNI